MVTELIKFGKKKYKLHRIEIKMNEDNKKSQAIPKRLGFTYEGTLKDVAYINGKYKSIEIWRLLLK